MNRPVVALRRGEVHREPQVGVGEAAVDVPVTNRLVAPLVDVDERLDEQRIGIQFVARHGTPSASGEYFIDSVDGTACPPMDIGCYTTYIDSSRRYK